MILAIRAWAASLSVVHSDMVQKEMLELAERQEVLSDKRKAAYVERDHDVAEASRIAEELEEKLKEIAVDKFIGALDEISKEEAVLLDTYNLLLKGA
jgi:DNA-binding transcriptional regulator YhcF (GntR family)